MQNKSKYSDGSYKTELLKNGYIYIDGEYKNAKSKLRCYDEEGYIVYINFDTIENKKSKPRRFHISNDYVEYNISHFFEIHPEFGVKYVSGKYENSKSVLTFECSYGIIFQSTFDNIRYKNNKCYRCPLCRNNEIILDISDVKAGPLTYTQVKNNLKAIGLLLLTKEEEFLSTSKGKLICEDLYGYKYAVIYDQVMREGYAFHMVHKSNPFSVYNINRYLEIYANGDYTCISDSYVNVSTPLLFGCNKCGRIFEQKYSDIKRIREHLDGNQTGARCPHCDQKQLESAHAIVLKQIWLHEYPDTSLEDYSCINPITNHVLPTDIVNHKLKIAIEIQSWFHDFEDQKVKDRIKKDYWINRGYHFYAVDQRDYTILEMVQLFFPEINTLPDYIDMDYANRINDYEVQKLLNEGYNAVEVAKMLGYKTHQIYDAVHYGRITYPENYKRADYSPVVQLDLDGNFIKRFDKIKDAINETGSKYISSALLNGNNYSNGYFWVREDDYNSGNYTLRSRYKNNNIVESSETAG